MSSRFHAPAAEAYDQMMGRWSRRLAPGLLDFAGLQSGDAIADLGCGTGSLTLAALERADVASIAALDFAPLFVEAVKSSIADPRLDVRQGDAQALPYPDATFDRAFSLLVLHHVTDPHKAIDEMYRVLKPGGVAAAAVWDTYGGMPSQRVFWDTIAAIEPWAMDRRAATHAKPMTRQGEIESAFRHTGFVDVTETMIPVRMDFASFEDFWNPQFASQADMAKWFESLPADRQERIQSAVRAAYLCNGPDGPRSFALLAWAVKGRLPA